MNKISFLSAKELVFTKQMCQLRVIELCKVIFQEKKVLFLLACMVLEKLMILNSSHHLIKLNHKEDFFNSMGELPNISSCNNFILT